MKPQLTIADVQDRVREARVQIQNILYQLEEYTGCTVDSVDMDRVRYATGETQIVDVRLDVKV